MRWRKKILIGFTLVIGGILIAIFSIAPIRAQITQIAGLAVAQTPIRWNNVKDAAAGDNQVNGILVTSPYLWDGANFDAARGDIANGLDVDVTRMPAIVGGVTPAEGFANPANAISTWSLLGAYNGATWDRALSYLHGDGLVAATYPRGIGVGSFGYMYNGATYDRIRGALATGLEVEILTNTAGTCGATFYAIRRDNITNGASVNLAFGFTSRKVIVETAIANTNDIVVDWLGGVAVIPGANVAGDDRIAPGRIVVFDDYAVTSISVIADSAANQVVSVRAFN